MKHRIEKLDQKTTFQDDNKKWITMEGYAFMDETNNYIIIVYGEGRRDTMSKYLSSDSNELSLKYKIINLKNELHKTK